MPAKTFLKDYDTELLAQIDLDKPHPPLDEVRRFDTTEVGWIHPVCGHKWVQPVANRVYSKNSCPVCAGRKLQVGVNDLASRNPEIAKMYDTSNAVKAEEIFYSSHSVVRWQCLTNTLHKWTSTPNNMTNSSKTGGCPFCAPYNRKTLRGDNTLEALFPAIFTLLDKSSVDDAGLVLPNSMQRLKWTLPCGHTKIATANSMITAHNRTGNANGCQSCIGSLAQNRLDFLALEWDENKNGVDFVSKNIIRSKKYYWLCKLGHSYESNLSNRLYLDSGCPVCSHRTSRMQIEVRDYLASLGLSVEENVIGLAGAKKDVDIYIKDKNIAIEFNGIYWHSEVNKPRNYHIDKKNNCTANGVRLLQIWEDDWRDNKDLVKKMLAYKVNASTPIRYYARKLFIRKATLSEARDIANRNHLQGFRAGTAYYALVTAENAPVAVLTVIRYAKKVEVARYVTETDVSIVGGFSKLLKAVETDFSTADEIISYSANDISDGDMYQATGFTLKKSYIPEYFYIGPKNKKSHRLNYTKAKFKKNPNLLFEENMTERELAALNGLIRVWTSGNSLWVKKLL
jgi:hypothetical protein